jgi:predicted 3-demethylubiquinone-9 3-methyltransferase (glyoxalase superfamily)
VGATLLYGVECCRLREEMAKFYVGIFKNSKIGNIRRSDKRGKLNENEMVIWKSGDASR